MKTFWDAVERVVWTGFQAFCASIVVTQSIGWSDLKLAGLAAAISAAKCVVALKVGDKDCATLLPAKTLPPAK